MASRRRTTFKVLNPSCRPRWMIIRPSVEPAADWSSHSPLGTARMCRAIASTRGRVDEIGGGLLVGDVVRDRPRLPRRDDGELGPVAPLRVDHHDSLALDEPAEQARPDLVDDADPLEARRRRQIRQDAVSTLNHQQVRRIDRAAIIRTRTSPGPGLGSGTSRTRSTSAGSPKVSKTAAFMQIVLVGSSRSGRTGRDKSNRVQVLGDDGLAGYLNDLRARSSRPHSGWVRILTGSIETTFMAADLLVVDRLAGGTPERPERPRRRHAGIRGDPAGRAGRRAGRLSGRTRRIPGGAHPRRGLHRLDDRHHRPRRSGPVQIAPPARFAEAMAVRGIGDETHVVAVDHAGGQFATRLWWALQLLRPRRRQRARRRLERMD